ncbi:fatty acid hydroxylase family protein [Solimonas sp. K1W22B-7]|uniref:sterol desaturase family protein n=1 Tax=Solimonas sp. K1W22B-7 TaxID=2303331 RepID=UPI000E3300EC|nr:sterol desaturase family protein [Solimonas sp. K1W22B-7]AXQ30572.1 fatty acid hydroxylase family protein [Solimonas sp. K1W22B-7]
MKAASLWNGEIPPVSEKYRRAGTAFVVLFALWFALSFLGWAHYVAYLGPGLGDDWSLAPLRQLWRELGQGDAALFGYSSAQLGFAALLLLNLAATAGIIIAGYLRYPAVFGRPYPLRELVTFFGLNAINALGILLPLALIAAAGWALGFGFTEAFGSFDALLHAMRGLAQRLPTLVDVPGWLAFLLIVNVGGFFHYWAHRLSHESRLFWLLFHRTHHMTPELIQPATQAVFFAFPLFLVAAPLYVLVFAAIARLITQDLGTVVACIVVYKLLGAGATTFSHQGALYHVARRSRALRALSLLVSEGPYHTLHHSSEAAENGRRGNLVNIGGGMFFLWDRLFGTFRPLTEHQPQTGLEGRPRLRMNPLRLGLAGCAQILYELRHNPRLADRLRVLCLGSDYCPPRTRDYALAD